MLSVLAAIGATAGMVGHDIRNPLQAITSDVYLAKVELASVPDAECKTNALESLTEIEKNISTSTRLCRTCKIMRDRSTHMLKKQI